MNAAIERLRRKQATRALRRLADGQVHGRRDLFPIEPATASLDVDHWQGIMLRKLAEMGVVAKIGERSPHMKYKLVEGAELGQFMTPRALADLIRNTGQAQDEEKSDADAADDENGTTNGNGSSEHPVAAAFLSAMRDGGLLLELASDDQIKYRAKKDVMTPELRGLLEEHKEALVKLLKAPPGGSLDGSAIASLSTILAELPNPEAPIETQTSEDVAEEDEVERAPSDTSHQEASAGEEVGEPIGQNGEATLDVLLQQTLKLSYGIIENCIYLREQNDKLRQQNDKLREQNEKVLKGIESLLVEWKIPIPWAQSK